METINYKCCEDVNFSDSVSLASDKFDALLIEFKRVFADPVDSLPFNTRVEAAIRTKDEDAVYSKSYPYPPGLSDFVNNEISDLLKNKII